MSNIEEIQVQEISEEQPASPLPKEKVVSLAVLVPKKKITAKRKIQFMEAQNVLENYLETDENLNIDCSTS